MAARTVFRGLQNQDVNRKCWRQPSGYHLKACVSSFRPADGSDMKPDRESAASCAAVSVNATQAGN